MEDLCRVVSAGKFVIRDSLFVIRGVALAVAVLLAGCGKGDDGQQGGTQGALQEFVGKDFAALEVQTLDGEAQPLKDLMMEGKPVVLNVWATWCAPCLQEMPTLDALGREGKYTVVAIATDADAGQVKEFLKKQTWGPGVRVWFDKLGRVTREKMGATAIPASFVLTPSLTVVMAEAGERDWVHASMRAEMAAALKAAQ